jgi:hypothetical protein
VLGGNHVTRKHRVFVTPSRFKTRRTY